MRRTDSNYEDKVWVDEARKLEGIRRDVAEARAAGHDVLIVAHFETLRSVVARTLREHSIEHRAYASGDSASLCTTHGAGTAPAVWLGLASHRHAGAHAVAARTEAEALQVLVAEHHPLPSKDEELLAALDGLSYRSRVTFHMALTDALLARFVGDGVRSLLEKLGHAEDECLSHPFISSAIRGAQEKIAKQSRGEMPTLSAGEWLKYNMGPGR